MAHSRRNFLLQAGRAGGYSAAFALMQALDLAPAATKETTKKWNSQSGRGKRVVIVGGGMAGLTAAFELQHAGFQIQVLEARERPGGRNWTIRRGDEVKFATGFTQTPDWSAGSYFNAGAARIPSIHRNILKYCSDLGVQLEVEVNSSRSSLLLSKSAFDGKPVEQRQAINDTRGHVSELLAKAIDQHALDTELTEGDRVRMLDFLREYGDLDKAMQYQGSERAGLARMPGAGETTAVRRDPLALRSLLDAGFWQGMLFEDEFDNQATMFQPVGGMDKIAFALARRLGPAMQYSSPVNAIEKIDGGVRVTCQQARRGAQTIEADFCVCATPPTILRTVENNFAPRLKRAIENSHFSDPYKIAWESKRFWETDYNIYGGISWLSGHPISQVWYPSASLFSQKGVVVSGFGTESASDFGKLTSPWQQFAASRDAVELLHPGHSQDLANPVYVNWGQIPWNLGGWARPEMYDGPYAEFIQPDERIHFIGDHVSHISAWQEGAVLSAHRAVQLIVDRVKATS